MPARGPKSQSLREEKWPAPGTWQVRVLGSENPIPLRDRESHVNAINKAEFIELASQGQAPTQTHRSDWADKTPSLFREDLI
jgi:hypothetical protein